MIFLLGYLLFIQCYFKVFRVQYLRLIENCLSEFDKFFAVFSVDFLENVDPIYDNFSGTLCDTTERFVDLKSASKNRPRLKYSFQRN